MLYASNIPHNLHTNMQLFSHEISTIPRLPERKPLHKSLPNEVIPYNPDATLDGEKEIVGHKFDEEVKKERVSCDARSSPSLEMYARTPIYAKTFQCMYFNKATRLP
jgi:hypothetical protein